MNDPRAPLHLDQLRQSVAPPPAHVAEAAAKRVAGLATPPGALGRLGELAVWIAATQGQVPPRQLVNVRLVVFTGDHGVANYGVSAFPATITAATVRAALAGRLGVNALSLAHGICVRVLDMGVDSDFADLPKGTRNALQKYKIRRSSGVLHLEDALTRRETETALAAGALVAREEVEQGAQLVISGDLGIGNTTAAAALIAAGLGLRARDVVGRGTGIDDAGLERKVGIVDAALTRLAERASDPIETLAALGSADLAAATGYLLTAARLRVPALLDGLMAVACAYTADRIAPGASQWFAAGHRSTEPAQSLALSSLGLVPILDLGLSLGEGSGAVAAVPILRSAAAILNDVAKMNDVLPE